MVEQTHTAGWLPDFYEPLRNLGRKMADWFAPKSEASASKESYKIIVELPGISAENVEISAHDNALTVRGEKCSEHKETGDTYFFSEREYGAFQRTFRLPPDANQDAVEADLKDGVLTVIVEKVKAAEPAEKKIKIKVK